LIEYYIDIILLNQDVGAGSRVDFRQKAKIQPRPRTHILVPINSNTDVARGWRNEQGKLFFGYFSEGVPFERIHFWNLFFCSFFMVVGQFGQPHLIFLCSS